MWRKAPRSICILTYDDFTMHTIFNSPTFSKAMNKLLLCLGMLCGCVGMTHAQHAEVEADLHHIHVDAPSRATLEARGDMLFPMALPFVDDFAWPSMAHEKVL